MSFSNNPAKLTIEQIAELQDFGFSAVDAPEIAANNAMDDLEKRLAEAREEAKNLRALKRIVMDRLAPMLKKLMDTSERDYIYWPNRKEQIEALLKEMNLND
jgi:chromosome condensin MukBEF ATPase and DNA-binding subunit MukB